MTESTMYEQEEGAEVVQTTSPWKAENRSSMAPSLSTTASANSTDDENFSMDEENDDGVCVIEENDDDDETDSDEDETDEYSFSENAREGLLRRLGSEYDTSDFEDDSDSSDSSDYDSTSDYATSTTTGDDLASSNISSAISTIGYSEDDDWSSADDDEYENLMAEMPIAIGGRPSGVRPPMPRAPAPPGGSSAVPFSPLPVAGAMPVTQSNPLEGLAMLQNIRSELEQVGKLIVAKKEGEDFLKRAHVLASINWLAKNVPTCVLDHLGKEIRKNLNKKDANQPNASTLNMSVHLDDEAEASDLSDVESEDEGDESSDESFALNENEEAEPRPRTIGGAGGIRRFETTRQPFGASARQMQSQQEKGDRFNRRLASLKKMSLAGSGDSKQQRGPVARSVSRGISRHSSLFSVKRSLPEMETETIAPASHFQCALLFIDISGFTKLSTVLDPENLSKVINSYFKLIVDKVFSFDGDIQKFAGDALFAEWRESESMPILQCAEAAAACAASVVKDCSDFPVMTFGGRVDAAALDLRGSLLTSLNVHCGLGVGEMVGIHVGNTTDRREYIYLGNPIEEATKACDLASLGQVLASRGIYELLSRSGVINKNSPIHNEETMIIAERGVSAMHWTPLMQSLSAPVRNAKSRGITHHVDGLHINALMEYRRLMSLYVHPVVVSNDMAASDGFRSSRGHAAGHDRRSEEAELRSVYVMFVHPDVSVELSGNKTLDMEKVTTLNEIMNLTTRELKRYNGHLRQLIRDDKGVVIIATFGLRGSTFPNLVGERGLPATVALHNALSMELGIDSRIGATFGDVYCGPVGGADRYEYAVMGPSVNLAARLMCSSENPGILVDNAVRRLAARSYGFNALAPVKAKGYKDLVPIFEPLVGLERSWGRIEPRFVGRETEIKKAMGMAQDILRAEKPTSKLAIISSSSGMGKSTMLVHSIEHIRRMMGDRLNRIMVCKSVGRESDAAVPFRTIRPILLSVLQKFEGSSDGASVSSRAFLTDSHNSMHLDNLSVASSNTKASSDSQALNNLRTISGMLDAPNVVLDRFQRTVLGEGLSEARTRTEAHTRKLSSTWIDQMVQLAVQIFSLCTEHKKLVVVALDDVHQADIGSWLVLRQLFEQTENVLIMGTSCTMSAYSLRMEEDFWAELSGVHSLSGRFVNMELGTLTRENMELMTMKALGLARESVSPEILNEVVVQSGGMPKFAVKILESIQERKQSEVVGKVTKVDESIGEIILHRVDSFDLTVRNTLNVGAIMGDCFSLMDVLAVMQENSDAREEDVRRQTVDALQTSVREGILYVGDKVGILDVDVVAACVDDDAIFTFYHTVWRKTLMGLMLDSRKRDVHRKIAQSMEKRLLTEDLSIDFNKKLFNHWRSSGDTTKATSTALLTAKVLEGYPGGADHSIALYEETLRMWGWDTSGARCIAGFSPQVLDYVEPADLSNILSLLVNYGRTLSLCQRQTKSISAYEDALRILQVAKSSVLLKDRSVIFPAFVGLSNAIAAGYLQQDVYCRYEKTMLQKFLEETRMHGRLIHHVYALYLQMMFCSRQGELDKAIAVQSVIKAIYKPGVHSQGLRSAYGQDVGAVSFSMASFFQLLLRQNRNALKNCRRVCKDLIPKVETDFYQVLSLIYPLLFVLKETGYSKEASRFFEKVIIEPFGDHNDSETLAILAIYEPLSMLLDLSNRRGVEDARAHECLAWTRRSKLGFKPTVNWKLGRLGRCADSICAELCLKLADNLPKGCDRDVVLSHGHQLATRADIFNRRHGLVIAQKQIHAIALQLKALMRQVKQNSHYFL